MIQGEENGPDGKQRWQRRVVVLGGLVTAMVGLRLLSSCAAGEHVGARLDGWSAPTGCTTCSSPEADAPTG